MTPDEVTPRDFYCATHRPNVMLKSMATPNSKTKPAAAGKKPGGGTTATKAAPRTKPKPKAKA